MVTADFLTLPVPDSLSALGLLWVACICFLWGMELAAVAFSLPCPMPPNGLRKRLYFAPGLATFLYRVACILSTFHFWLSAFFSAFLTSLFIALGHLLLRSPNPIELWAMLILVVGIGSSTMSFIRWTKGQEEP